jgi:outer membrane protein assembly factor BamB
MVLPAQAMINLCQVQQKIMQTIAFVLIAAVFLSASEMGFSTSLAAPQKSRTKSKQRKADRAKRDTLEKVTSNSRLALPFKQSWQYLTERATTLSPVIDNDHIYLALTGGRVTCLNLKSGALVWSSELGGTITSPVAVGEKSVYVATRKLSEDGSEAGASIRAMDKSTGLTLWARDYPRRFASALTVHMDSIYAGSADGSFYALKSESGEVIWKTSTQDVVRGLPLITDQTIYFGSDDGALRAVEKSSGKELWKLQTRGKIAGRPVIDSDDLYFGSGDGFAYSVKSDTGRLRWRSRTGAAIEASATLADDRLLIASFDNFIYSMNPENGDRVWKQRMDSRITAQPIVEGDAVLIAPLHSNRLIVLLSSDGRAVSSFTLEEGFELAASPMISGNYLVIPTDKGIVCATSSESATTTNPPRP